MGLAQGSLAEESQLGLACPLAWEQLACPMAWEQLAYPMALAEKDLASPLASLVVLVPFSPLLQGAMAVVLVATMESAMVCQATHSDRHRTEYTP